MHPDLTPLLQAPGSVFGTPARRRAPGAPGAASADAEGSAAAAPSSTNFFNLPALRNPFLPFPGTSGSSVGGSASADGDPNATPQDVFKAPSLDFVRPSGTFIVMIIAYLKGGIVHLSSTSCHSL